MLGRPPDGNGGGSGLASGVARREGIAPRAKSTEVGRDKRMPEDSTTTKNPAATRADFTYSITPRTLVIRDTGQGKKTVFEDLPAVLRRIEHWHQGSVAHLKLTAAHFYPHFAIPFFEDRPFCMVKSTPSKS